MSTKPVVIEAYPRGFKNGDRSRDGYAPVRASDFGVRSGLGGLAPELLLQVG